MSYWLRGQEAYASISLPDPIYMLDGDLQTMREAATPALLEKAYLDAKNFVFSLKVDAATRSRFLAFLDQRKEDLIVFNQWGVRKSPLSASWLPWAVAGGAALLLILSMRKRANP